MAGKRRMKGKRNGGALKPSPNTWSHTKVRGDTNPARKHRHVPPPAGVPIVTRLSLRPLRVRKT